MSLEIKPTLLLFNLAVDENDPILGFAVPLIARISRETASVHVLTMRTGLFSLPSNVAVYSAGRERGAGKIMSVIAFYRHLFAVLRATRVDACFSHMNPLFVALAGPILALRRIPIVLWYSHRHRGFVTKIAHQFAWRILTSVSRGYAVSAPKVIVAGHMVATELFRPALCEQKTTPPVFLSVGRIAPIKDLLTFVRAAGVLREKGHAFKCICVGPVLPHDAAYYALVRREIRRLSLENIFFLADPVTHAATIPYYQSACAHINLCPTGSLDKAALEAMACGTASVFANTAYVPVTGVFSRDLLFAYGDPESLARVMAGLLALPQGTREAMGVFLRGRIVAEYSMDFFMRQFMRLVGIAHRTNKCTAFNIKKRLLCLMASSYNLLVPRPAAIATNMAELTEIQEKCLVRSDISDHLIPLFFASLAVRPHLIVELGVRGGDSTFVLERVARLCGARLVSVDREDCSAVSPGKEWLFVRSDDIAFARHFLAYCREAGIPSAIDILFVDTSHDFEHTTRELRHWFPFLSDRAKVFFHDTNAQRIYRRKDGSVGIGHNGKRGVMRALEVFFERRFNEKADFTDYANGWLITHRHLCSGFTSIEKLRVP